jgi:hypothetical protein
MVLSSGPNTVLLLLITSSKGFRSGDSSIRGSRLRPAVVVVVLSFTAPVSWWNEWACSRWWKREKRENSRTGTKLITNGAGKIDTCLRTTIKHTSILPAPSLCGEGLARGTSFGTSYSKMSCRLLIKTSCLRALMRLTPRTAVQAGQRAWPRTILGSIAPTS